MHERMFLPCIVLSGNGFVYIDASHNDVTIWFCNNDVTHNDVTVR